MADDDLNEFFGEKEIKELVEELWSEVFKTSNSLIKDTKAFGFGDMEILPNPNIFQMLNTLTIIDNMIDIILPLDQIGKVNSSVNLLNAKQQILNMEMIATAIKSKNREAYDEAVRRLHRQAQL